MAADDDHYAALGLEPGAGREEVREAWRFLLAAFHPDRFRDPGQRGRAEEITKRVNAAWQVLGDADARRRYDRRRGASSPAPPAPRASPRRTPADGSRPFPAPRAARRPPR